MHCERVCYIIFSVSLSEILTVLAEVQVQSAAPLPSLLTPDYHGPMLHSMLHNSHQHLLMWSKQALPGRLAWHEGYIRAEWDQFPCAESAEWGVVSGRAWYPLGWNTATAMRAENQLFMAQSPAAPRATLCCDSPTLTWWLDTLQYSPVHLSWLSLFPSPNISSDS